MKSEIGMTIVFGAIAMSLWNIMPRLMNDAWHARDFVPAQSYTITNYKCTNWNGFMFNACTTTFVSQQSRGVTLDHGLAVRPGAARSGPAVAAAR